MSVLEKSCAHFLYFLYLPLCQMESSSQIPPNQWGQKRLTVKEYKRANALNRICRLEERSVIQHDPICLPAMSDDANALPYMVSSIFARQCKL